MGLAHTGTNPLLVLELGRMTESTGPELRVEKHFRRPTEGTTLKFLPSYP